jgi:hypothetical protein
MGWGWRAGMVADAPPAASSGSSSSSSSSSSLPATAVGPSTQTSPVLTPFQPQSPNPHPVQVGTVFLQRCAAAGLTLAAMGNLMSRPLDALDGDDSHPSELERACVAARVAVETAALVGGGMAGLTLAEGDEEGEEEDGEDEGGEGVADGLEGASPVNSNGGGANGLGVGGRVSAGGGLAGLMFDLEGEGEGSLGGSEQQAARSGSCELAAPQSPFSQVSIDSVGSGGVGVGASVGGAGVGGRNSLSAGGAPPGAVARSVYAGNGFMWRAPSKTTTGVRAQSPRRALGARPAYPPPVMAVPPRSTSEVLSGLSEEQWAAFMERLTAIMDEQLRGGGWTQSAANPTTVAMSCPRF